MLNYDYFNNTLADQFTKDLPDYDDYMYLRGYSMQEVYTAFHKTWNSEIR